MGGSMPRATSRASGLILLLISLASCSEGEGPAVSAVDDYLLPQAAGVQLGMSWKELRSVRPGVRNKDGVIYENSPEGRNIYLFRRQDEAPKLGSTKGHVAAVLMYPPPGLDEEDVGRRVDLIREQWSTRIGPPRDSPVRVVRDGERKRSYQVLTWSHGDVHLRLEYEILPLQQQRARSRGMLATVEEAGLPGQHFTPGPARLRQ
jgi:hypothetical protein